MYLCVCVCVCVCVCKPVYVLWMRNFSKRPAAAWQGPAPLQFLPVLGRGRLGREQPILSGFQSTSNVHTAPASTWAPLLLFPLTSGSLDICFSHDTSEMFAPVGWEEWTVCFSFQNSPSAVSTRNVSVKWCNWMRFWLDWKRQCKGNSFQQDTIPQGSHVWSKDKNSPPNFVSPCQLLYFLFPGFQPKGLILCYICADVVNS